ncbi:MAG: YibE/F family protein [Actinomycetes bacterium]
MSTVDLATRTHRRLLLAVGVLVLLTVGGMVALWPTADQLPEVPERTEDLLDARILDVERYEGRADPVAGLTGENARITVALDGGDEPGREVVIDTPLEGYPDLEAGDRVRVASSVIDGEEQFFIVDFQRGGPLALLAALFVAAVVLAGGWHGVRSLLGLALSLVVVTRFVVPGILSGQSPFAVALVGAMAVMLLSLYLAHGVNEMTTTAVVGTAMALGLTIGLGALFIDGAGLTGYSSEEANLARFAVEGLDLQGLVLAGLTIAALGVLDDVTVSQASTVFALHEADRRQGWATLFGRAMTVGRDHIASTVNTLFLAYAGASLALLVVFSTGGLPVGEIVTTEILAEEIVKTLVGSLGIIAAVPFTTALATTLAVRRPLDAPPLRGGHVHAHVHAEAEDAGADPTIVGAAGASGDSGDSGDTRDNGDTGDTEDERARRAWREYLRERDAATGDGDAEG